MPVSLSLFLIRGNHFKKLDYLSMFLFTKQAIYTLY